MALAPGPAVAHEIPRDVTVRAFVRPEGQVIRLVVRAPLEAMRDLDFPQVGPGFLDLAAAGPLLQQAAAQWLGDYVVLLENGETIGPGRLVTARVSLPSDLSFSSFDAAWAHTLGEPLPAGTLLPWRQALLDAAFEFPITSDSSRFAIRPFWHHLGVRTLTVLWYAPPGRAARPYQFTGDPGLINLDPRWHQAAARFVRLGVEHILDGIDHLLFLLCLVIPMRSLAGLIPVVTAFTVAHSITLIAAALGLTPDALWFPPLIEALIALSIVYMAIENVVGAKPERRWRLAFGFGLVHGFGFSFALRESLQFAGNHLLTSLLAFNLGVELGQLLVVAVAAPLLALLFRRVVAERVGTIVLSVLVGHTAWHWMIERAAQLREYQWEWPALDAANLAAFLRWVALLLIVGIAAWLLGQGFTRLARRFPARQPDEVRSR